MVIIDDALQVGRLKRSNPKLAKVTIKYEFIVYMIFHY